MVEGWGDGRLMWKVDEWANEETERERLSARTQKIETKRDREPLACSSSCLGVV